MEIHVNTGGPAQTNGYLLVDTQARVAALIDAPKDATAGLLEICRRESLRLEYLLLTHGHWDHISDHALVTQTFPQARILMHALDVPKLEAPSSLFWPLPYTIPPGRPDGLLDDGQEVQVGGIVLRVLHTPGHSPGHVCFHAAGAKPVLFAGDLLMAGTVGRYDLPDCSLDDLLASLRRVMTLPDATPVLSGHGPATRIGHERNGNPFLRGRGII